MKQFPFKNFNMQYIFCIKLLCFIFSIGLVTSCITDEINPPDIINPQSEGYMKIKFDMPSFHIPTESNGVKTRAMEESDEIGLDIDRFNVLVFKNDGTFYYQAPLVGSIQITQDAQIPSKATGEVTVKLVKSDTERFNIMVVSNCYTNQLNLHEGITTKEDVIDNLSFNTVAGKWNTSSVDKSHYIPMWGEANEVQIIENNMPEVKINLYRALARIDVGLAFKIIDNKMTEDAEGLNNFKISQVNVYRTYDKGYVSPLLSTPKPGQNGYLPSIPADAQRLADENPLQFRPMNVTNNLVREIYVPEANLPASPANNNMHCIVIEGYYGESVVPTYYRLDFAQDVNESTRNYLAILRNHRYIFNILDVKEAGFETPELALQSTPSGTIDYEVIVWDETIHEMHVHGKYYFGLDNREITFQAKKTSEEPENLFEIKYQTNYPISEVDGITFTWENPTDPANPSVSPLFEAKWIERGERGTIQITALTTNETNTVLTDVLHVKLGSLKIKIKVNQEYVNFKYTLDCAKTKVYGTYRPGYQLNSTHYIELSLTVDDVTINGFNYQVYTEPINGIAFSTSGTFSGITINNRTVNLKLTGSGKLETPEDAKIDPFSVTIKSNSSSGSYCEATITPVIPTLRVATIANNSGYGYDLGKTGEGGYLVVKHPGNFGPNDNSIVKMEGFEFFRLGNNFNSLTTDATSWLRDGMSILDEDSISRKYLADILYVGHDGLYNINSAGVQIIMDYMKKGGVVVMFNEGSASQAEGGAGPKRMFGGLFPNATISTNRTGGNAVIPFVGNDLYKTGTEDEWNEFMYKLQSDPILNGPFGDIRDKQWGEDLTWATAINTCAFPTHTVNGETKIIPDITIYSYIGDIGETPFNNSKNYATGFKYETDAQSDNLVSFVFFGDGGFISHNNNSNATSPCPFWWDTTTMFPRPKPNYRGTGRAVYNSQVLANTMAWAVQRSADLFVKREEAMGR